MLFGASTDAPPLSLSPHKLILVGIGAVQEPQTEFGPSTRQMGPTDRAVMASYTEESTHRAPMKRVPQLRRCGARIVSIAGEGSSCLRDTADALLAIPSK